MAEVGLFADRHIDLLQGVLYEMPPMHMPHMRVVVRFQWLFASFNAIDAVVADL